jgi:exopolysaccharide biosynthesis polyprenyl glycosylphosphotransferase
MNNIIPRTCHQDVMEAPSESMERSLKNCHIAFSQENHNPAYMYQPESGELWRSGIAPQSPTSEGVPPMSEHEIQQLLVQQYFPAQRPFGRWKLAVNFYYERLSWLYWTRSGDILKRVFDFCVSFTALVLLSPLFVVIGLLVKLQDGGPIFFAQTRVGRHGKEFKMFKVRSMCLNAEEKLKELISKNQHGGQGITFKIKDDPRITKVGRWLRKLSLDELPQLYNVLLGDMSLVGPRPPLPREVKRYSLEDHRRLAVKPGITCFWQISGRSEIDFKGQVRLDVSYIENRSFWVDLKILAKTLPAVISGKGAC